MGNQSVTQILTIFLIISIIVLFFLVIVFISLAMKKKQEDNKLNNEDEMRVEKKQPITSNSVQTKMYTTENIKNFMDFDEIKDNMIVQKNGKKLIMVIQCQGVNYDLMSSVEKVGVEQGFIQFLNTLTRPIQLHIQARKVNLEDSVANYKKRLKSIETNFNKIKLQYEQAQRNPNISDEKFKDIRMEYVKQKNLYEYTQDIISNTEKMSLNKNILTKNYYIAISYFPDNSEDLFKKEELIDMAFSELYTNAQSILRTLSVCGITGKVLDSTELADLLYVAYNRDYSEIFGIDKAIKAGYDALYTTAPDVINKKIETLDKMINERALNLANTTLDKVVLKNKRQKELEMKEKNMKELIKEMAKSMIRENEGYIEKSIVEESIAEIENDDNAEVIKEVKKKRSKKGA